jgi:hypothetical protein
MNQMQAATTTGTQQYQYYIPSQTTTGNQQLGPYFTYPYGLAGTPGAQAAAEPKKESFVEIAERVLLQKKMKWYRIGAVSAAAAWLLFVPMLYHLVHKFYVAIGANANPGESADMLSVILGVLAPLASIVIYNIWIWNHDWDDLRKK